MRLVTLGGLQLEHASFGRVKPLLLMAYLALEGPKERRYLAELFWPDASDPLNSLSAALTRLRKGTPGAVEADEVRVWANVTADTGDFLAALEGGDIGRALSLYRGPFLDGAYLPDWGAELEEWVYAKREDLASRVRLGVIRLAETEAAQGRFAEAASRAETAHTLSGAPAYEPEELTRLYLLLQAGDSPVASVIRAEAEGYGVALDTPRDEARARLQRTLIGREREQQRLMGLSEGEWVWLRGSAGMGKTALLKTLPGTYLLGRAGLPYATLEPLVGPTLSEGEAAILQRLLSTDSLLLFDNWERIDAESQALLRRLRDLRAPARVVIASRDAPPFEIDLTLRLEPLSEADLEPYPDAYAQTGGLPALVEAYLRDEPLRGVLESRLDSLNGDAREVALALATLETPDLALVRRALSLSAARMASAMNDLLSAGLIEPSGVVHARQAFQDFLDARPTLAGPLYLKLARCLDGTDAYPLYQHSRPLWEDDDEPRVMEAYLAWARELLRRGFPQQAYETLLEAPEAPAVTFLKGRALERAGRYQEAFDTIQGLADTADVLAIKSTLYWRLGKPEEARKAAGRALDGDMEARAEAQTTLGRIDYSTGDYQSAVKLFRRAAALWLALGERTRWAGALNNVATARSDLGENVEEAYREALEAAKGNAVLEATLLLNLGSEFEHRGALGEAEKVYRNAILRSSEAGLVGIAGSAWNNLGVIFHMKGHQIEARDAYEQGLQLSQKAGDQFFVALSLANIAELDEDIEAWEEAMRIFEFTGNPTMAERYRAGLPENHPFRARSEQTR